jgi:lysyl-tRNA synthetase class 1
MCLVARDTEDDWVSQLTDQVLAAAERRAPGRPVVVASGLSPSGPIHLGNLREVMTPHLVADEIRRRGGACVHILSWDDYDRFRRVPVGIDPSWSRHIGKPLSSVPAPEGSRHASWAEHFKAPLTDAAARLGIEFVGISQTERYTSGAYVEQVLLAMRERKRIDAAIPKARRVGCPKTRCWRPRPPLKDRAPRARTTGEQVGSTFPTGRTAPSVEPMPRQSPGTTTTAPC